MPAKQELSPSSAPAPRRPRQRRKEARPGEIIDAALALWAEQGFAATRLEAVATRAGIAKGTIYLYFPSKEALFEAALRDRIGGTLASVDAQLPELDGGLEAELGLLLHAIYDRLLETDSAALLKVLIGEGHRLPALVELYREVALASGLGMVRRILEQAAQRGELRLPAEAVDPRMVVAPAIAAAIWRMLFGAGPSLDRAAYEKAHLDLVLRGLLTRPRQD